MAQVSEDQAQLQKIADNVVKAIEDYHKNGNWDKLFYSYFATIYLPSTTPDGKKLKGFAIIMWPDWSSTIRIECRRDGGRLLLFNELDRTVAMREIAKEVCNDAIDYAERMGYLRKMP
jgi:hypothetical protein